MAMASCLLASLDRNVVRAIVLGFFASAAAIPCGLHDRRSVLGREIDESREAVVRVLRKQRLQIADESRDGIFNVNVEHLRANDRLSPFLPEVVESRTQQDIFENEWISRKDGLSDQRAHNLVLVE